MKTRLETEQFLGYRLTDWQWEVLQTWSRCHAAEPGRTFDLDARTNPATPTWQENPDERN